MIQSNYDAVRQRPDMCDAQPTGFGRIDDPKLPNRAVPQALAHLEKEMSSLGEYINELRNRLKPVMQPELPETGVGQDCPASPIPVVQELDRAIRATGAFSHQVRELILRLEI